LFIFGCVCFEFGKAITSTESKHEGLFSALINVVDKLHQLGLGGQLKPPRIVVGGNQSAGKSSVLEAISQVCLPRQAKTCTRCPIEIRLRPGDTWQCSVKLHFEGKDKKEDKDKEDEHMDVDFGPLITNKAELGERISRAQKAVLNPQKDPLSFLNDLPEGKDEHAFTRDMVVLNISGPDLPALTLVDLPGLIEYSDSADPNEIEKIKELLFEFAQPVNTIIVCVITATADINSQGVLTTARRVDPEGVRTLGVLTKPDRIESGTEKHWAEEVATGSDGALALGYYMVKNPSQQQLLDRMDHQEARKAEKLFFEDLHSQPYWSSISVDRLGTSNLSQALSALLMEIIYREMPRIVKDCRDNILSLESDLKALPPTIVDSQGHLRGLITVLCQDVHNAVKTSGGSKKLIQQVHRLAERFKKKIDRTKPQLHLLDEAKTPNPDLLDGLKKLIKNEQGRNLRINPPAAAFLALAQRFVEKWLAPMEQCAQSLKDIVEGFVIQLITSSSNGAFKRFSLLQNATRGIVIEALDQQAKELLCDMQNEYRLQRSGNLPNIMSHAKLDEAYKQCQDSLRQEVRVARKAADKSSGSIRFGASQVPEPVFTAEDTTAIDVFAQAQAYFEVESLCLCEQMLKHFMFFLDAFDESLPELLRSQLGVYGDSDGKKAAQLLQEDKGIAQQRSKMESELERLRIAEKELKKLPIDFADSDSDDSKQP